LAAFRSFGGDPTTTNQYAPSYYFLINSWYIKAENVYITLSENLYSDDYNNPFVIINSSILSKNSDIGGVGDLANIIITGVTNSISDLLTGITENIISGVTNNISESINDMAFDIKLILGLVQHNYRLSDHVYDSSQRLTFVVMKLYNSKTDCDAGINNFATYHMNASYDSNGLLIDYKVVNIL